MSDEIVPVVEDIKPEKKPSRKLLTAKEHRFLEGKIKNEAKPWHERKSDRAIMKEAGYAETTAIGVVKRQLTENISANEILVKRLNEAKLGIGSIVTDIQELRKAINDKGNPDNDVRFRTLHLQCELQNVMPPKKVEVDERKVVLNITQDVADRVKKALLLKGEQVDF